MMRFAIPVLIAAAVAPLEAAADPPQQRAWKILEEGVKQKHETDRAAAVTALALVPEDHRAKALAEAAFDDASPVVRRAAALAVGEMLSVSSIPLLRQALRDDDVGVVMAAAKSLDALRNSAAYEVYYAVLAGQRKGGGEGLGAAALPYVPVVGAVQKRKKDEAPARVLAAAALAHDPDPRSAEALTVAAYDPVWAVRVASIAAIAKRGDPLLLNDIAPAMADEKPEVRYTAAAAVLHLAAVEETIRGRAQPPQ